MVFEQLPTALIEHEQSSHLRVLTMSLPVHLCSPCFQVVQHMPGREAPDAPGDGHCDAVLSVASHPRLPMLATGGHEKDSSIKIWTASSQQ